MKLKGKIFGKDSYFPLFIIINIFLFFFLMQNPIYNVNTAFSDTGIYQLISKEMLNGKILYKDVFDHKGPFIFFIYLISYLIGNVNLGLFIIDLLLFNVIFYLNYKTIKLNQNNITSYFFIVIELFVLYKVHRIVCPESFMLLAVSYMNYWILSKQYLNPTFKQLLTCGILTGLIFWIKFSLGVYIAVIYFYFVYVHIKNKTFNYKYILYPLIGFLIPTTIVFGYFIYNNALFHLFNNYFIVNKNYGLKLSFIIFRKYILLFLILTILVLSIIKKNKDLIIISIAYILLFIVNLITIQIYIKYYYIPFISIFSIFILFNLDKLRIAFKYITIILLLVESLFLIRWTKLVEAHSGYYNGNVEFAKDVDGKVENAAVFFNLDPQMLANLDSINYKYFFTPNLVYEEYPDIWETYYNDVKNKEIEYVVFKLNEDKRIIMPETYLTSDITLNMIDKILDELYENYKEFNKYNDFIVYKRKES